VFEFDASSVPTSLTKVTDRPQGTMGAAISPDASAVFWFDDSAGDEVGRWQRHDLQSGAEVTLLPDEPATYGAGIHPLPDGGAVLGRLLDEGFEIAVVDAAGSGRVAYSFGEPAFLVDATTDASLALVGFAPGGDWLHLEARVVRLSDGEVIAELAHEGKNVEAVGFHPNDPSRVLLGHEPDNRVVPMVWNTATGAWDVVVPGLDGYVSSDWSPDGAALLLTVLRDARHTLHRLDLGSGQVTSVPVPTGSVSPWDVRAS
jgi:hypothetical protein